eukprot:TRINITY_DN5790_c0_g1_i2.p1 TRINITY_DN5790_c0_g1~~TRINITY_DN5790_c0_g1_i2.p1  ORF type:complete len:168 (-),score=24.93 TRINITY_DN5790_c0_g1_i2:37-540(-)
MSPTFFTLLICIGLLFCYTSALQFAFTLQYKGTCDDTAGFVCQMKAFTESIQTNIYSNGSVAETVTTVIGALSTATISKTNMASRLYSGNATFGIHTTMQNHFLVFQGQLTDDITEDGDTLICFGGTGLINGAGGAWTGATGAVSLSGCYDPSDTSIQATVVSRVFA